MKTESEQKIYDKLVYICWCQYLERENFLLLKTHDEYKNFLESTKEHFGDCTSDACSCYRCILQRCEIEAQNIFNYLFRIK